MNNKQLSQHPFGRFTATRVSYFEAIKEVLTGPTVGTVVHEASHHSTLGWRIERGPEGTLVTGDSGDPWEVDSRHAGLVWLLLVPRSKDNFLWEVCDQCNDGHVANCKLCNNAGGRYVLTTPEAPRQ